MKRFIASLSSFVMIFSLGAASVIAASGGFTLPAYNCADYGACTVYVDDSAIAPYGGTVANPYKKISDAVNAVISGSTYNKIRIAGGTYTGETLPWVFDSLNKTVSIYGGYNSTFTTQNPVLYPVNIQAGGADEVLKFTSVGGTISGLTISGSKGSANTQSAVSVSNSGATTLNVDVVDNIFHGNDDQGSVLSVVVNGTNSAKVEGNILYNNTPVYFSGNAVFSAAGNVSVNNNLVYGNSSYNVFVCGLDALVYDNFFMGNTGVTAAYGLAGCDFVHNSIVSNTVNAVGDMGLVVMKANGNSFVNNILAHNTQVGGSTFTHDSGDTSEFNYNVLFDNTNDPATLEANNVDCDPLFADENSTNPVNLKLGSGSACIDKGTNLSSVTVDYFGLTRPADGDGNAVAMSDPGAYEAPAAAIVAPVLSNLSLTLNPFSPDGDSVADTTTFSFDLNTSANVTVGVYDLGGSNLIKKLIDNVAKSAGTVSVSWDGKETGNAIVPSGDYLIKVNASNGGGVDNEQKTVTVDSGVTEEPPVDEPLPESEQCANFIDVSVNSPSCSAITYVKSIGAMTGNPDGTFAPSASLQRDQIAKISLETFGLFDDNADYCSGVSAFPDVTSGSWSYQYICRGKQLGMITGYMSGDDLGKYVPGRSVNRVEFLALILRNLAETMPPLTSASYDDVDPDQWFSGYAKFSQDNALFTGTKLFPSSTTTRVEVAEVIYNLHQLGKI